MEPFALDGPLPTGTTVLEASAGTGKTYAVGALVARFVAEGRATLDELLVITFGRAASQELRQRVREALTHAERALADPASARAAGGVEGLLADALDEEVAVRRRRLADALAAYDAATIATTHQFCHLVLTSLGVAGDTEVDARLVEDLDDLVVEVTDDLYLARYGDREQAPPFGRDLALTLAREAVGDPQAVLAPSSDEDPRIAERYEFCVEVRAELERRKRRLGLLSYDDLLSRLADALADEDSPARERMRQRWSVVLVDEFQDTDPVQWQVLDRAFRGHATLVLIGDPKQAIYAFRGGDIAAYLSAAATAGTRQTLAENHRSDAPLVNALQAMLLGVWLGDAEITVSPVVPALPGSRLLGAPDPHPVRLRQVRGDGNTLGIGPVRRQIAEDLAADVARLLASDATWDGRPIGAGDVAVLMPSLRSAGLFREALHRRGIPTVVSGGASVLLSPAADHWLTLLEALEQPHRPARVRAVGLTPFVGLTAEQLAEGGDPLTDELAERIRGWLDSLRLRGIGAVFAAALRDGLAARVLAAPDGERLLTDLEHLAELLHEQAHRSRLGVVALLEWLRAERRRARRADVRTRRLDTDARAVQFLTVHASKGLQFPVVHLPLAFNRWVRDEAPTALFHVDGVRTLDVSGRGDPRAQHEAEGEELRLAYVALTRAQSQVVAWIAPTRDAAQGGLTRLLLGRRPGEDAVPARAPYLDDAATRSALDAWAAQGALAVEDAVPGDDPAPRLVEAVPALEARSLTREVDTVWRRTSYSGLIRAEDHAAPAVVSEPEVEGTVDELEAEAEAGAAVVTVAPPPADDVVSPMAALPAGAAFGSLVHGVLEVADPHAPDLLAELRVRVAEQQRWWSVEATAEEIAEALVPMQHTPLGPLAAGLTLGQLGLADRLCELDFEFPLTGGDHPRSIDLALGALGGVMRRWLPEDDLLRPYADRLETPALGDQVLRGYLSGSIDVVLRVPDGADGHRFVVVDYKTNLLGEPGRPVTAYDYTQERMAASMLHSHYPLQAMLYSVVLHRYLRWRLPGYDAARHLGGVLYLYVRGMCGPGTPVVNGQPCGVFAWRPPAGMVAELSDVLDGRLREESR